MTRSKRGYVNTLVCCGYTWLNDIRLAGVVLGENCTFSTSQKVNTRETTMLVLK